VLHPPHSFCIANITCSSPLLQHSNPTRLLSRLPPMRFYVTSICFYNSDTSFYDFHALHSSALTYRPPFNPHSKPHVPAFTIITSPLSQILHLFTAPPRLCVGTLYTSASAKFVSVQPCHFMPSSCACPSFSPQLKRPAHALFQTLGQRCTAAVTILGILLHVL
jgi:hypothetical protein